MTQENDMQALAPMFKEYNTNTGTDIYAHIECFNLKAGQESAKPFRISTPFVYSRRYGSRQVVIGSVCETLRNIREQIRQLAESTGRRADRLEGLPIGEEKAAEFAEYEREMTNTLVLVSCLLRNVFHIFPRLAESVVVPMFDYDESPVKDVRMKVLLDLFVHNRYMYLHNEYVTDLFSDEPPKGTTIAEKFMGYRFKVNDFLIAAQDAIHSITVKDVATRLRSGMVRLTVDTPHHEMVFLIQNAASFADILKALVPIGKDAMMAMLYPEKRIPKEVKSLARDRAVIVSCSYHAPRVRMGYRVDPGNKTMVVSVTGQFRYTVDGEVVYEESADCEKEVEYGEFFDRVIAAGGDESLLELSDRR